MVQIYTADASAFLHAFNPGEAGHAESRRFFERIREKALVSDPARPPASRPRLLPSIPFWQMQRR